MNRKQLVITSVTPLPKLMTMSKSIRRTTGKSNRPTHLVNLVNKLKLKRLPINKIKKSQKQNNFLLSPNAINRSNSKRHLSLVVLNNKEQNDFSSAIEKIFNQNKQQHSEQKLTCNQANIQHSRSGEDGST
jgi:hypothetical protein